MIMLQSADLEFYRKNGYFLYREPIFKKEKLQQLESIMEEHLQNKGKKRSDELDTPHFHDKRLLDFLMAPEVLNMVEKIIGPNIGLWSSHFICKEPVTGRRTPWHEDSAYWKGRFDRMDKIVTVWLALDKTTTENGCMGVIPGTHVNGFSGYRQLETGSATFTEEINEDQMNLSKVVWFELEKGHCSLHDSRIVHGANANTSTNRRCGYTMRYFSLDMKMNEDHPGNQNHRVYHCKGANVAENPLIYS
jgi:ectoine hydroxylase-related dioxygenase (phytanoyl-CoA dioxygenase family)